jgi:class 3 adenylate cyclase
MNCPDCQTENPLNTKFCIECGAAMKRRCSNCGSENLPRAKFCGECGLLLTASTFAPLSESDGPTNSAPSNARVSADGERRHLTVLFCDLADSTALASQMDPEDWRAAVAAYHLAATDVITRFGGHVAKYLGDGVMAFFGYPEAHDNDAERAARAALGLLDALAMLNESSVHPRLAARIGIDSGPVVVGVGAGPGADVFGDVPNVAARVQSSADLNSVFVTAATHRLISGLFITEDRGAQPLKGLTEPLPLHRIVRPSGARGRLEAAAAARGLTLSCVM